ncbi:MAG: DNA damage-inducible protein D [Oscillospiraceae bacterium]|nr:DNA damage-inducible protein D [Oscillospiraceae bacterium]
MSNLALYSETTFEDIKQIDEYGNEFWSARELCDVLEYSGWQRFGDVVRRALEACEISGFDVADHFNRAVKMVDIGSGAKREQQDLHLSRHACYLIVMNGDPSKEVIALGQTYFAVKARQQELIEQYDSLTEDQKRIEIRQQMKVHNKSLAQAAQQAGVTNFAAFHDAGYKGLYDGLTENAIHQRKGLGKGEKILDHMGSTELAANLFRATQTDEKLRRDNIQGKQQANEAHFDVGAKVRQTIKELGGTMPEDLPTPDKSIQQIEWQEKKKLKA